MNKRILISLLPLILVVSCSIIGDGYIEFTGSGSVAGSTCWIKVQGNSSQVSLFDSPSYGDEVDFDLDSIFQLPNFLDDSKGTVYYQIKTQIEEYAVTNQGYWFQLSMTGFRTAAIHSDLIRFHEGDPEIYRYEDNIFTFSYWVNIDDVIDVDERFFDNSCLSMIEAGGIEALAIEEHFYCEIIIASARADLRVGAGRTRGVRMVAESGDYYDGIGQAVIDGELWYQIKTGQGNLWVLADNVNLEIAANEDASYANCLDLPTTDSPPIIQYSQQNDAISSIQDCTTFTILRPIGTVPEGESTYRWSPVDEADQYVLNFSDYQGNYVTSTVVDGSQTSVVINTGSLATGSQLSVEVVAIANNETLCRTNSGLLTRTAGYVAPETPAPQPNREPTKEKKSGGDGYTPPET